MATSQRVSDQSLVTGQGMKRGAAYILGSHKGPTGEEQYEALLNWAKSHQAEIVEWFVDSDLDAGSLAVRPMGRRLLERAPTDFDFLVVLDWSRLSLDGGALSQTIRPFLDLGLAVYCIQPTELETSLAADLKATMN